MSCTATFALVPTDGTMAAHGGQPCRHGSSDVVPNGVDAQLGEPSCGRSGPSAPCGSVLVVAVSQPARAIFWPPALLLAAGWNRPAQAAAKVAVRAVIIRRGGWVDSRVCDYRGRGWSRRRLADASRPAGGGQPPARHCRGQRHDRLQVQGGFALCGTSSASPAVTPSGVVAPVLAIEGRELAGPLPGAGDPRRHEPIRLSVEPDNGDDPPGDRPFVTALVIGCHVAGAGPRPCVGSSGPGSGHRSAPLLLARPRAPLLVLRGLFALMDLARNRHVRHPPRRPR